MIATSKKRPSRLVLIPLFPLLAAQPALATSFEKPIPWSGKYAGFAGAATSQVRGSASLFHNPAGLANGLGKAEITTDFSPTYVTTSAPVTGNNTSTSGSSFVPFGSLFGSYQATEKLGVGVGAYIGGGLGGSYGDVNYGATNAQETSSQIASFEVAVGAGYALTSNWSLGLAWRGSFQSAEQKLGVSAGPGAAFGVEATELSGTNFSGLRAGLQYRSTAKDWGAGVTFRSATPWKLSGGTVTTKNLATGTTVSTATDGIFEGATLPWQLLLGAHVQATPELLVALQYDFTNHAINRAFTAGSAASANTTQVNSLNGHTVRLGGEYAGLSKKMPLRAGYSISSPVTPANRGVNFGAAPDSFAHTFSLGLGNHVTDHLDLDAAFEYMVANGTGVADATNNPANAAGDYKASFFALHLGLTYIL